MTARAAAGSRNGLSLLLTVLAAVTFVASLLAVYAEAVLFDAETFADRSVALLEDDAVRRVVVDRLLDEAEQDVPALGAVRVPATAAVDAAVATPLFSDLFAAGVREAHKAVFDGAAEGDIEVIVDYSAALRAATEQVSPELAGLIPNDLEAQLLDIRDAELLTRAADTAEDARQLAFVLPLVTAGLAVGAVALAADRRRAVRNLGLGALVVGVTVVGLLTLGRALLQSNVPAGDVRDGAGAIWDILLNDLRRAGLVAALAGAATATAAILIRW